MEYRVGAKGQVVIAKEIRERLGVQPNWRAIQRLVGDHVEIRFLPPPHRRSLKGVLGPRVRRSVPPGPSWDEAREAAWAQGVREDDGEEDR
ncbi:MAG: AbrB/MazE/SpoVT family DNA-binding domain-containing protein [Deferrisomatales bacterium]